MKKDDDSQRLRLRKLQEQTLDVIDDVQRQIAGLLGDVPVHDRGMQQ